jgi:disulfide bond formation protein DsbB
MTTIAYLLDRNNPARYALAFLVIAVATILGALGFEHIGGYQPCALCLMQRTPYYLGFPLAALTIIALMMNWPRGLVLLLFAGLAVLALYNAGLGIYHSGVEWRRWEGPASCTATGDLGGGSIIERLKNEVPPSCTDAVWRFLGLSFAGWNVIVSLVLAGLAIAGFNIVRRGAGRSDQGSSSVSQ